MKSSDFNTEEEKDRQEGKAFLFVIFFEEFIPYLDELSNLSEDDKNTMLEEYKDSGEDSEFYGIIEDESLEIADIITKIIKERSDGIQPKKGDVIRLRFLQIRQLGTYFWDGEKAIIPEEETSDCYCIPSILSIPEFPVDYWDDCGFTGWSNMGDFYYDTSDMKLEECKINDLSKEITLYRDMNSDYYVLMYNGEDKKATMKRFVDSGRCFGAFYEDGSCYGKLQDSGRQETIEKISNYIFQHEGSPKNTVYVDYDEDESDEDECEDECDDEESNKDEEESDDD
jgi:hypothetical protein